MLIVSNDSYFIFGLSHIVHKIIPSAKKNIIFDAGGQVIYVLSPSDIIELHHLDPLSALLANKYTTLPKNSPTNDYIDTINKMCRRIGRENKPVKLSTSEIEVLETIAYNFLEIPSPDLPERDMRKVSFHKRNGLEKLGLKNDNIFCCLVATWFKSYSQLVVANCKSL